MSPPFQRAARQAAGSARAARCRAFIARCQSSMPPQPRPVGESSHTPLHRALLTVPHAAAAALTASLPAPLRLPQPPPEPQRVDRERTAPAPPALAQRPALQPAATLTQAVADHRVLLAAWGGFAAIACAVFASGGGGGGAADAAAAATAHPLLLLDAQAHGWVASTVSEELRHLADTLLSDAPIAAGVAGWGTCSAAVLSRAPGRRDARALLTQLAAAWAAFFTTCGALSRADPLLVNALKHAFARARPSTLHHTYSFPSGHTSAAFFVVGALLAVLLPLAARALADEPPPQGDASVSNEQSEGVHGAVGAAMRGGAGEMRGWRGVPVALGSALWVGAGLATASGRVLADAHWVSDTLAGACLATGCVSGLALLVTLLDGALSQERAGAPTVGTAAPPPAQQGAAASGAEGAPAE